MNENLFKLQSIICYVEDGTLFANSTWLETWQTIKNLTVVGAFG
jgi:hypothetical protein